MQVYVCVWLHLDSHHSLQHAYLHGQRRLQALSARIAAGPPSEIPPGKVWYLQDLPIPPEAPSPNLPPLHRLLESMTPV